MKGKFITLLTMVMILALTGQAFAYFDSYDLVFNAYYDEGLTPAGREIAVDLNGAATGVLNLNQTQFTLAGAGTINLSQLGVTDWSMLRAGIWGKSGAVSGNAYMGTNQSTAPLFQTNPSSFFSATTSMYTYYDSTTNKFVGDNSAANSYDNRLNSTSDTPGYYAGMNRDSGNDNTEAFLSGFDAAGSQYVDLWLYNILKPTSGSTSLVRGSVYGSTTDYAAIIRINEDGSLVLNPGGNPPVVPIPAGFLLFGSGLLGLMGLRRKNA
jgi:hypothetical protein